MQRTGSSPSLWGTRPVLTAVTYANVVLTDTTKRCEQRRR